MYIANVIKDDPSNGPGYRVSVWVSGCTIRCPGCHNKIASNFKFGQPYEEVEADIFKALNKPYIAGLSVLGGDPCEPSSIEQVTDMCRKVKAMFPDKTIWLWTGRHIDDLKNHPNGIYNELFTIVDVIVDGPFKQELHSSLLEYMGSSNQRILYKGKNF